MEFGGIERRRAKRITHHYVIRFRQIKPPIASEHWDLTTVKDISKTGISFYASHHYELGVELEIKMKNPLLQKETTCWVTVVRCHSSELKKGFYEYEVAVKIDKIEEPKDAFYKTIEFFIREKDKK